METLKKIVSNQYFPAGAVLAAVLLFWAVGLLGGLSLLHNNQPPLTTLTWLLFVYAAAVLTPLAGILAATDLVRRWRRNRAAEAAYAEQAWEAQESHEPVFHEDQAPLAAPREPAPAAEPTGTPHAATHPPAPTSSQPTKNSKRTGRKQAA